MIKNNISKLFKVISFILLLIIFDFLIGLLLEFLYFNQKSGSLYRTTYGIEEARSDLIVFGSSRANHHYHPDTLEQRLNISYYNVGRDGRHIPYSYAMLKMVLERHTPRIIILDIRGSEFIVDQDSFDRLSSLFPYYKNHPEIGSIIEHKSRFEKFKMLSRIYTYNSLVLNILIGCTEFSKYWVTNHKGFLPLEGTWEKPLGFSYETDNQNIDYIKISIYEDFIKDCIKKKIKLYIVRSPFYVREVSRSSSIELADSIAKEFNVPFIDFGQDSLFLSSPSLFKDILHLNETGAGVFTSLLVKEIKKIEEG